MNVQSIPSSTTKIYINTESSVSISNIPLNCQILTESEQISIAKLSYVDGSSPSIDIYSENEIHISEAPDRLDYNIYSTNPITFTANSGVYIGILSLYTENLITLEYTRCSQINIMKNTVNINAYYAIPIHIYSNGKVDITNKPGVSFSDPTYICSTGSVTINDQTGTSQTVYIKNEGPLTLNFEQITISDSTIYVISESSLTLGTLSSDINLVIKSKILDISSDTYSQPLYIEPNEDEQLSIKTVPSNVNTLQFTESIKLDIVSNIPTSLTSIVIKSNERSRIELNNLPSTITSFKCFLEADLIIGGTPPPNLVSIDVYSSFFYLDQINIPSLTTLNLHGVLENGNLPKSITKINVYSEEEISGSLTPSNYVKEISFENAKISNLGCKTSSGSSLTTVTFGNSIKSISGYSFQYTQIETLILPSSLTKIRDNSFSHSPSLKSIQFNNDGNTILEMYSYVFENCSVLESLVILPNVHLNSYNFRNCPELKTVTIPQVSVSSRYNVFDKCNKLNQFIISPVEGSQDIELPIFIEDSQKICISFTSDMTSIPDNALKKSLISELIIPSTVLTIGHNAFASCNSLEKVTLSLPLSFQTSTRKQTREGATTIPLDAFDNTKVTELIIKGNNQPLNIEISKLFKEDSLVNIELQDVTSIDSNVFTSLSKLTTVVIPSSVTQISGGSFIDCPLVHLTVNNDKFVYKYYDNAIYSADETELIAVLSTSTTFIVPTTVSIIGEKAFYMNENIEIINLQNHVTQVKDYAFYGCTNLKEIHYYGTSSITEGSNILSSGSSPKVYVLKTYAASSALFGITVEKHFEMNTYNYECGSGLTCKEETGNSNLQVSGTGSVFGPVKFTNTPGFISVDFSKATGITSFAESAFKDLTNLISIVFPSSITTIPKNCFSGCTNLATVSIESSNNDLNIEGIQSIGENAFYKCESLELFTIPSTLAINNGVDPIGKGAFSLCKKLTQFKSSSNLYTVDSTSTMLIKAENSELLFHPSANSEITIPSSIKLLNGVYNDNTEITSVQFEGTEITIKDFNRCTSLEKVILSMASTVSNSFEGCSNIVLELTDNEKRNLDFAQVIGLESVTLLGSWKTAPSFDKLANPITVKLTSYSVSQNFFKDAKNIKSIDLNDVTFVYPSAFENMRDLESIDLRNADIYIYSKAFASCPKLSQVMINPDLSIKEPETPNRLNSKKAKAAQIIIYSDSFDNTNVQNLVIGGSEVPLSFEISKLFKEDSLVNIELQDVTSIDSNVFTSLSKLTTVVIPSTVTTISGGSFIDCPLVEPEISKENHYVSYSNNAFYSVPSETEKDITLLSVIARNEGSETFIIPDNVTRIGEYAFAGNDKVTSIIIPENVDTINIGAFSNCENLKEIRYEGTKEIEITEDIFLTEDEEKIPTIKVPENYEGNSLFGQTVVKDQPEEDDPTGLSGGAIAGIVIAVLVVVAVVAFLVYWFVFRHKDDEVNAEAEENDLEVMNNNDNNSIVDNNNNNNGNSNSDEHIGV